MKEYSGHYDKGPISQELENDWYQIVLKRIESIIPESDPPLQNMEKHALRRYIRDAYLKSQNFNTEIDPFVETVARWLADYGINVYEVPALPGKKFGRTLSAIFESGSKNWVMNELSKARHESIKPYLD